MELESLAENICNALKREQVNYSKTVVFARVIKTV